MYQWATSETTLCRLVDIERGSRDRRRETPTLSPRHLTGPRRDEGHAENGKSEKHPGRNVARVMHATVRARHANRRRDDDSDDPTDDTDNPSVRPGADKSA